MAKYGSKITHTLSLGDMRILSFALVWWNDINLVGVNGCKGVIGSQMVWSRGQEMGVLRHFGKILGQETPH